MASNICKEEIVECPPSTEGEGLHHTDQERLIPENNLSLQQPEIKTVLTYIVPYQPRDIDGACFSVFLFACFFWNFPFALLAFRAAYLALRRYKHDDELGESRYEWWAHTWTYIALLTLPCYLYFALFVRLLINS
ncbi:uncharacterized protein LOC125646858 [Ostrea edulis]|uniref:uncharacterized protein LOC125646858 n=1 Tax=Ostrea edulis TaxID=37623 RepID=UPI0020940A04|nr:uncharacterized protein LOC125646858 [Ostrea edulis]